LDRYSYISVSDGTKLLDFPFLAGLVVYSYHLLFRIRDDTFPAAIVAEKHKPPVATCED